jgi:hypothetical protein
MAAMRLMGIRDCVGVVTKDIFLGLQPTLIWHAFTLAAALIPRWLVRLPSALEEL